MSLPATTWALVPIKASGQGKSRLAGVLSERERGNLVDAMLRHVIDTAADAHVIGRTLLVGPSRSGLDEAVVLLDDPGEGLNAALEDALSQIAKSEDSPDRLIVIAGDLPNLIVADLDVLAKTRRGAIGIAPDRHGVGTNALSLPLPESVGFRFHYGMDSAARHAAEAQRLGLGVEKILREGLQKDIDEPSDLVDVHHGYTFDH